MARIQLEFFGEKRRYEVPDNSFTLFRELLAFLQVMDKTGEVEQLEKSVKQ